MDTERMPVSLKLIVVCFIYFIFLVYSLALYKLISHKFVAFSDDGNPDELRTKKSELRVYCDLLMQQVHVLKTFSQNSEQFDDGNNDQVKPDAEVIYL